MSSLLLLIDGYNVLAPAAPPARGADDRWLHRERTRLIERLVGALEPSVRSRTCVVFDAADPPRDRPSEFTVEGLEVRFAVEYPEADDLLEQLIAANSSPKQLAVVSSDNRVRVAASRRGCTVYDSQLWLDDLLDGVVGLAAGARAAKRGAAGRDAEGDGGGAGQGSGRSDAAGELGGADEVGSEVGSEPVDENEVDRWMREFGF